MKVLHLPTNIASQISVTVRALRQLGVDARGLALGGSSYCDPREIETHQIGSVRRRPVQAILQRWRWSRVLSEAIDWADVVHWHFNTATLPWQWDLRMIARRGKARLVEFWGTDIRIPRLASQDNPYFEDLYYPKKDKKKGGTGVSPVSTTKHWRDASATQPQEAARREAASLATQRRFGRWGFACVLPSEELRRYVRDECFERVFTSRSRVMASDYEPAYPDAAEPEPLVVHAPSHQARKGTDAVLRAVEALQSRHRFRFELIHGRDRSEALEHVARCDIFLDQFVAGCYGLAAVEAMALGKPCVCYLSPGLPDQYPDDLPIVNATQESLPDILAGLLADGPRRRKLGEQGRAYVERYHDAPEVARGLVDVYEQLLHKKPAVGAT
ncbi:MAG: glycosyltransferase family 4 protein [Pirellulales bacterium]|nr:glycosyltransferase family 4 protein [Pirellulales bacterium]